MPWRATKDPYKIWVSEIILQQTRVSQGLPYYRKFIQEFPNIRSLAKSKEQKVLKMWQGLGYYSRARNMHQAAKQILAEHQGRFPTVHGEIRKLKGIGEYTAAAIASFAFDLPHPVVDGNVFRVLSRYFNDRTDISSTMGKARFTKLARQVFEVKHAATHNQAIMELGALQCTPISPDCDSCPLRINCKAFRQGTVDQLPVKSKKVKIQKRYFNYFLIRKNQQTMIQARKSSDIWKGLYQLPLIESKAEWKDLNTLRIPKGQYHVSKLAKWHVLSHQKIHLSFWELKKPKIWEKGKNDVYVSDNKVHKYPFPKPIADYIAENISKNEGSRA